MHDDDELFDEPSHVDAKDGVVTVSGPDAVKFMLTPDAAEETADRLATGAMKARGQRYFAKSRGD